MASPGSGAVPGPWQQPVRGGHPNARHLALTGAEQSARDADRRCAGAADGAADRGADHRCRTGDGDVRTAAERLVRPAPLDGRLLARAHAIYPDGPLALADVSLSDLAGTLIAHGSSSCFIMDGGSPQDTTSAETDGSPDPWQRPAPAGEPGDDGPPLLERLTGLHAVTTGDGEATYANPGRRFVLAGAEVRDADDRLIAVASGSVMADA
jgi:hypothetical protein